MIEKTKSPGNPTRIAVLAPAPRQRALIRQTLRRLGHVPVLFDGPAAFSRTAAGAHPFGLVMVAAAVDLRATETSLRAVQAQVGRGTGLVLLLPRGGNALLPLQTCIDDFLVAAPASLQTLYPRMRRLLMRQGLRPMDDAISCGPYRFMPQTGCVTLDGEAIRLQPLEFDLAVEFFRHVDRTLSREWLYSMVWERNDLRERALDTQVSRLRSKLRLHGSDGWALQSVSRHGYRLASPWAGEAAPLQPFVPAWHGAARCWPDAAGLGA